MRVYVHIGSHKTGTKSIQAFLRRHADALAVAGIHIPNAGTILPQSGHHNIGWGLRGDPRFNPSWGTLDDFLNELASACAETAVISCEDLEYLVDRPADLARLDGALIAAGYEPLYLWFHRRPDTYAYSLYSSFCGTG